MEDARGKGKEGDSVKATIMLGRPDAVEGADPSRRSSGKAALTFELVSQHFSMPINQAARELSVGLTVLKKRCRELGVPRWPHRKIKTLDTLMDTVQEMGKTTEGVDGNLTRRALEKLQQHKQLIQERPGMMLDEETKRLRQALYKESYNRRHKCDGNGI
ncbi:hypothetical protein ACP4OV_000944 [Aristida adscensionis]